MTATYLELCKLPSGSKVEFVDEYDVYPDGIVPIGTKATVKHNWLNEINPTLVLEPEKRIPWLDEWDGEIHIYLNPGDDLEEASTLKVIGG